MFKYWFLISLVMKRRIKQLLERKGFDTKYVAKLTKNGLEDLIVNMPRPNSDPKLIFFPGRSIIFDSNLKAGTPYSALYLSISQGCNESGIINPYNLLFNRIYDTSGIYSIKDKIISWEEKGDEIKLFVCDMPFSDEKNRLLDIKLVDYNNKSLWRRIGIIYKDNPLSLNPTIGALSAPRRLLPADFGKNKPKADPPGPLSDYINPE